MGAGKTAVDNAKEMITSVCELGRELGLVYLPKYRAGETIWGAPRYIKVALYTPIIENRKTLFIDCIYQAGPGTAYLKAFAKIEDIKEWPHPGLLVFDGPGLPPPFCRAISARGAIPFEALEASIKGFFGL